MAIGDLQKSLCIHDIKEAKLETRALGLSYLVTLILHRCLWHLDHETGVERASPF